MFYEDTFKMPNSSFLFDKWWIREQISKRSVKTPSFLPFFSFWGCSWSCSLLPLSGIYTLAHPFSDIYTLPQALAFFSMSEHFIIRLTSVPSGILRGTHWTRNAECITRGPVMPANPVVPGSGKSSPQQGVHVLTALSLFAEQIQAAVLEEWQRRGPGLAVWLARLRQRVCGHEGLLHGTGARYWWRQQQHLDTVPWPLPSVVT